MSKATIETMAFVVDKPGNVPWLGLGTQVSNKMSPEAMLKAAKCDWTVSLQPIYRTWKGKQVEIKHKCVLTRDTDGRDYTLCSPHWKPVQNAEAADFFTKFTKEGHMSMEHMGSLSSGQYFWALANINKTFSLGKEDEIRNYLLMIQPHKQGRAMIFKFMSARTWCWNCLAYLLGKRVGSKGVIGNGFRMPHSMRFDDDMKKRAEEALGFAIAQTTEMKEAVTLLSKKKATVKEAEDFFCKILKFDPDDKENTKKKDGTAREPVLLPKFREALTHAPGQALPSAAGTWWGAVNAVTFVLDHNKGRKDDGTALRSAWLGKKSRVKIEALNTALDLAKKAKAA